MYTIGGVGVVSGVPVTPVSPGEHQLHASAAARTAGGVSGRLHDAKARLGDSGTQDVELGVTTSTAVATSELQCVICLGDYTTGESLCRLPCPFQHVYHVECINLWLDGHSTCPYCKYDLMLAAEEEQSPSATAMPPRAIATSAGSNAEPTYWPAV
ncbi:hypothetical protein JKP88DRAFT_232657 [Tribonema minus]|uniref:RING-type domain-containing protein n=1 Tax=Tribonema minus TaxID=303371 RepID=A0A836CLU7_9STRA|nr:hypothetical protein JKP88DRAFT_232657 [Tribonema minus]